MVFRMYPDVIDDKTPVSLAAAHIIMFIKQELAKRKPNYMQCCVLLNGDKYNEAHQRS